MKYIKQLEIILLFTFTGELLGYLLPFPIPSSIYGLGLLLVCLKLNIVCLKDVKNTADFFLDIMTLFFIPAGVGLINYWIHINTILVEFITIIFISTIIVITVSGRVSQLIIRKKKG